MDSKPFPTAKVTIVLIAVSVLTAFVFLVPVKRDMVYKFPDRAKGKNPTCEWTTWDLLVGNKGRELE